MTRTLAWSVAGLAACGLVLMGFAGLFPLFSAPVAYLLPLLVLIVIPGAVSALVVTWTLPSARIYCATFGVTAAAMVCTGIALELQGRASGRSGVLIEQKIAHQSTLRFMEPMFADFPSKIRYDRLTRDRVVPDCQSSCLRISGWHWQRLPVEEQPGILLLKMGVLPVTARDTRLRLTVSKLDLGKRVLVEASLYEGRDLRASLSARLPSAQRAPESGVPAFVHYLLRSPLVQWVLPRPAESESEAVLERFLAAAIRLEDPVRSSALAVHARTVTEKTAGFDAGRSDPEWGLKAPDERCTSLLKIEPSVIGDSEKAITFRASPRPGPHLRLSSATSFMCVGDAIYAVGFRAGLRDDEIGFDRYALVGTHMATLKLAVPMGGLWSDYLLAPHQMIERDGTLSFGLRKVSGSGRAAVPSWEGHLEVRIPEALRQASADELTAIQNGSLQPADHTVVHIVAKGREDPDMNASIVGAPRVPVTQPSASAREAAAAAALAAANEAADAAAAAARAEVAPVPVETECTQWAARLPKDYVVYAAGGEGGRKLDFTIDKSNKPALGFDVTIHLPDRNVVLVLGTYAPAIWRVKWSKESRVVGVWVSGYHTPQITGLDPAIPLLLSSYEGRGTCSHFYATSDDQRPMSEAVSALLNRGIDRMVLANDGRVAMGRTEMTPYYDSFNARSFEDFQDKSLPLAGDKGIEQLLRSGHLRRAKTRDYELWRSATQAGQTARAPMRMGDAEELFRAYVVQKPMVIPADLYGAHSVTLIVPRGVERPTGHPGHSTILDMND